MCLFPYPNSNINGLAYKKGITHFDCGACPECLKKRSSSWALRAVFEAKSHAHCCMITLTYDKFKYSDGRHEEFPVDPTIVVNKEHIQLFMKRLRKHFQLLLIKYICCAEYGNRTHRAHYHMLLFGVDFFEDRAFYKKSKRGNAIYMSKTLTKLWTHGIATIDCVNVHSAVARYCTKYCAKSRSDDTFMLASQNLGIDELYKAFNGKSYFIDGREYTIPRLVWQRYIMEKYSNEYPFISPKYINRDPSGDYTLYNLGVQARAEYRAVRDNDPLYIAYLDYWSRKSENFNILKVPERTRILQLPSDKHAYKVKALIAHDNRKKMLFPIPAPNSGVGYSSLFRHLEKEVFHFSLLTNQIYGFSRSEIINAVYSKYDSNFTCPKISRPNRASDTNMSIKIGDRQIFPINSYFLKGVFP